MEWNSETLHFLSQCFLHTLSPDPIPRRLAEASLCEASLHPHFSLAVLRLVSDPTVHVQIRHAAAVNFKNHLKAHWAPTSSSAGPTIPDAEKDHIKSLIVSITLSAAPKIQAQLVEALAVIGQALLPELVSNLQNASLAGDYAVINGILVTANSMFEKFQCRLFTQTLLLDLNYCLDNFAKPLLEIFFKNATLIDSAANSGGGSAGALRPIFESQRLCCRILYSLNFQYLPVFFEEHMKECMAEFIKYLTTSYPVLESSADGLELVDELRAAVCQYLNLCMQHRGGEFQKYLNGFAFAVCNLLVNVSQSQTRDQVAVSGIKFLTTVSTSVHHNLFADEGVILIIFRGIVIPNVRLRDEDEKMFEMDYTEYIRRDMEGCDIDTRRWFAAELLKGIATNNKLQVSLLFSLWKQDFLSSFATNPVANWKEKDCAIYLVVSLSTKRVCGNSAWTDLVDVGNFFQTVIAAELQSQDVNEFPMLKASALKFFTIFQNHIQKEVTSHFFPDLIRFLGAESNVVHSYAAISIEKLFLVKDLGGRLRYTSADFSPLVPVLMTNLFEALKFPESEQNQYVMKCILRVIGVAELSREFAEPCIARLTLILNEACENPVKSDFNHYLFESAVILVKQGCRKDTSLVSIFETNLLPTIQKILLGEQVTDFFRYAFELLHQFIELKRPSINSLPYVQFFEKLLSPESLDKASSDAHAFVCLLQLKQYLKKTSQEFNQDGRLRQVLETFNKIDLQ